VQRILLTGATGFVGKNVQRHLEQNYEVIGIGSQPWDLRSQDSCKSHLSEVNPDVVIHAAGTVGGIGANRENPGKFMYENLIMGTNIIHESMCQEIAKFILLGTVCSYPKFTDVPFQESAMWLGYPEETNAPYGIAKKTLMKLVETYNEQYGLCGVNLIPVNMYGPYDHFNLTSSHVIPALILKVRNALKAGDSSISIWGTGEASREFLFAADLGRAIELAIEKDVSCDPINIGTGKEIKIRDLVSMICEIMNFDGNIVYDTSKPDGQPRRCLDTELARKSLGFEATTSLREGLQETIDWFLANEELLDSKASSCSSGQTSTQPTQIFNDKSKVREEHV
jgi:GDP-L-fucose synthase